MTIIDPRTVSIASMSPSFPKQTSTTVFFPLSTSSTITYFDSALVHVTLLQVATNSREMMKMLKSFSLNSSRELMTMLESSSLNRIHCILHEIMSKNGVYMHS